MWMELGEAVEKNIIGNETVGYFLGRIFLFLKEIGVNTNDHVRLRQHKKD